MPGVDLQIVPEWGVRRFPKMFPRKQAQVGLGWEAESWKYAMEVMKGMMLTPVTEDVLRQIPTWYTPLFFRATAHPEICPRSLT